MDEGWYSSSSSDEAGDSSLDGELEVEQAQLRAHVTICRENNMTWTAIAKETHCSVQTLAHRRKAISFEYPSTLTTVIFDSNLDASIADSDHRVDPGGETIISYAALIFLSSSLLADIHDP